MKVVHIAFECAPIYKTGGLGDVIGALPIYQKKLGLETYVLMPGYGFITQLPRLPKSSVPVIYAESPYFKEKNSKHDPKIAAPKYAHFALQALFELKKRNIVPDIIHCHDWHTGLIPFMLKNQPDSFFINTKVILSIHNIGYQGNFPLKFLDTPETAQILPLLNKNSKRINFLKQGIHNSDYILTVSPNHAREIRKRQVGFGLADVISKKRGRFKGILNGIDYDIWNPKTDKHLLQRYSRAHVENKKYKNKLTLQRQLQLEINKDIPLFGMVARLSKQKGTELLLPLLSQFPKRRVQLVILGTGDKHYEKLLKRYDKKRFGEWLSVNFRFDEELAHRIYAASDFFLIPSLYEPCGLTQIIAMAYGSLPVATRVGGLADTVIEGKTGFLFESFSSAALLQTIDRALNVWQNPDKYQLLQKKAMMGIFSWKKSARQYVKLYHKLLKSSK